MLPDGERAKGPVVSEMCAEEFAEESLVRAGFGISQMGRIVTIEPLPDRSTGRGWNSPSARRQLGAGSTDDSPRRMRERRVVRIAKRSVAQRATGQLRSETKHGDDALAPCESVFDGPLGDRASNPVEDVCYSIV